MAPSSILNEAGLLTFQPVKSLPLNRLVKPGSIGAAWKTRATSSGHTRRKTGSLYHVQDVMETEPKDDGWFTEDIIVKDNTITVKVNGKQVVDWTQPADWNGGREGPGPAIAAGTIALQGHDPNSTVYYKNIRIKPLD